MLWFWHYMIGYLTIEIYGHNSEKILNTAAVNGVNIWNLYYKNKCIYGNISPKQFVKLFSIRHGTNCKIKIIKKHGLYFKMKNYKNRIGFTIGIAAFFAVLLFLSNFVWIINVEGNKTIKTSEIIKSCKKIGVYEGVLKRKISNKYDAQRLQLTQEGIAWCSLNIEGCVLTVNLSETKKSDKDERKTPSNIKADFDGEIKKIDVNSGNVLVKVGDMVTRGDLLVSGISENFGTIHFLHADGVIIAKTKREFSAEGTFKQLKNTETGKDKKHYTLKLFNLSVPLFLENVKQNNNYECSIKTIKLFDNKIPIKIACEKYKFTKKVTINYSTEKLEEILYNDIKNQVENSNFINVCEVNKEVIKTDKGILLKVTYDCEENIARKEKILLNNEN